MDRLLNSALIMIDGGARNGTWELPRLAQYIRSYGFEPNPESYALLGDDQPSVKGINYQLTKYLPAALHHESQDVTLYVTKRPGGSSTLRPNADMLAHFERDNWAQIREVMSEFAVPGITLCDFMAEESLTHIDFIKLDTQGTELSVLKSAAEYLGRISVIKTEVSMIPVYRDQPLLGDMCSFLAAVGFELIDIQWTPPCRRYHFSPDLPQDSYRLVWGDAIFARAPYDFSDQRKLAQGIVLAELGYLDLGLYIIEHVPDIEEEDREALLDFYRKPKLLSGSRLKRLLKERLPAPWLAAYRALRQPLPSPKAVARVP